ncbi:type 1 fimbrial protein [Salmonella enterica]|uniref:fimbrial protein n=1 Tax=Salmonella enterica TaxID=28901 RepID=UPI0009ADED29|nr:fimbrial protein [Salmonella enterica]ELJ4094512.1 type 1 fimbrial protein [Salmonella enterica]
MKPEFVVLLTMLMAGHTQAAPDNVHFSGALVAEPCTLPDEDTSIQLDFGSVIEKYLYQYTRTQGQPFTIHLLDCDPSMMNTVSVMFTGTANTELTDLLATETTSSARGVAIGIELQNGVLLPVNKPSPYGNLAAGNNDLNFTAFVQATPSAIANKTLGAGDFRAIATFQLSYQ